MKNNVLLQAACRPIVESLEKRTFFSTAPISTPFGGTAALLPGTIQAANFDNGGEGVAYHDTDAANYGGAFRTSEGVDIQNSSEGGYDVGWTFAGEWMNYTVNVPTAGTYTLNFRVSSPGPGGQFHLNVDGVNATGELKIPGTGAWQTYTTVSASGVNLTAGQHVLQIDFDSGSSANGSGFVGNIEWFQAVASNGSTTTPPVTTPPVTTPPVTTPPVTTPPVTTPPVTTPPVTTPPSTGASTPYGGVAATVPGTIELANFDDGGEGVAYHKTLPNILTPQFRNTGVYTQATGDTGGGYNVGFVYPGEWLQYTVNVQSTGTYALNFRVASPGTGGQFHLNVDGVDATPEMTVPGTGAWQTYTTVTDPSVSLTAGMHVFRLVFDSGPSADGSGFVGNFNWMSVTAPGTTTTPPVITPPVTTPPVTTPPVTTPPVTTPPVTTPPVTTPPVTTTPSSTAFGINLSANADWGLQDLTADIPLRTPGQLGSPWNTDPTISVDGAGDVTAPNGFSAYLEGYDYPNGTYTMTFTAQNPTAGQFTATGVVAIAGAEKISGNTITVPVTFQHNDPTNMQSGTGWLNWTSGFGVVGNIHLTEPGGTPGGLTPYALQYLSTQQSIRFMNLDNVNDNITPNLGAADVPTNANGFQVSYQEQAQWSNAAYTAGGGKLKSIWINVPVTATDAYIQAVAKQIYSVLNSNIAVKFELGNELWNTATFSQAGYVLNLSRNDTRLQGTDDFGRQAQESGILEYHAAQVFEAAFPANFKVTGIMGSQGTDDYVAQKSRQGIEEVYGVSASQLAKVLGEVAVSVYPGDSITSATSVQDLFNQVRADFARQITGMQQASADAVANGQILDVYEWSPKGYLTRSTVSQSIINAAVTDPGMAQLTQDLWNQVIKPYLQPDSTAELFSGPGNGWSDQVDPATTADQEFLAAQALLGSSTSQVNAIVAAG